MSTKLATILADFTTSLATALSVGGTSATLQSATDDDAVALPAGVYFFTLDGANSNKEHIVCTLNGTAITGIYSVSRQGVQTLGVARSHRIGCTVTITDFGHLKYMNDLLKGSTKFDASVPLGYDGAPTLTGANDFATLQYVLDHVNGGPVSLNEIILSSQTAGETFSAGQPVYLKASDSRWYKLLANDSQLASVQDLQMGIALSAGTAGNAIASGVAIYGYVSSLSGLSANNTYYVNDSGALSTTPGTYSISFGWALSTTILVLNPKNMNIPTPAQKSALTGSQGAPSTSNKFLTQDNWYDADADQTQTTQDSSQSFGEANSTSHKNKLAQSFVPTKTKIRGAKLYKNADSGTFTGTVTVALQADSAGSPSGSNLASGTITNAEWLSLPTGEFEVYFSTEYSGMTQGNLYWLVASASTSDTSNHPNIGANSAGGYAAGSVKYNNTTDGWVSVATIALYFKSLEGISNQLASSHTQTFSVPGTWTWIKPAGAKRIFAEAWGSGGGGGGATAAANSGGGGGGGAYNFINLAASSVGSTETVTVGAGGAGGVHAAGTAGNTSSFGAWLSAYGGGGGGISNVAGTAAGGGGGGWTGAGTSGSVGTGGTGGGFGGGAAGNNAGTQPSGGGGGGSGSAGGTGYYGGGGGTGSGGSNGSNSIYGGAGGGCGYYNGSINVTSNGGTSTYGGNGGNGTVNSNAQDGSAPGGGGGGAGASSAANYNGGKGGDGQVRITVFF